MYKTKDWEKGFDKKFSSQKDHITRDIGNGLVDTTWYYYQIDEYEIKDFIQSLLTQQKKEIVEMIENKISIHSQKAIEGLNNEKMYLTKNLLNEREFSMIHTITVR